MNLIITTVFIEQPGEIEGRCKNEEINLRFERLKKELDRIRRDKEACILIGDMNKKSRVR